MEIHASDTLQSSLMYLGSPWEVCGFCLEPPEPKIEIYKN